MDEIKNFIIDIESDPDTKIDSLVVSSEQPIIYRYWTEGTTLRVHVSLTTDATLD